MQKSVKEAIEAFNEECQNMGTLEDVLEESWFFNINDVWEPRKPITEEKLAFAVEFECLKKNCSTIIKFW